MDNEAGNEKVSEAIVRFVQTGWFKATEQEIRDSYGEVIALKAKAVYNESMDCPVDWSKEDMNSALGILSDFLIREFPWLSSEARTRLNYCYIMAWK